MGNARLRVAEYQVGQNENGSTKFGCKFCFLNDFGSWGQNFEFCDRRFLISANYRRVKSVKRNIGGDCVS
ncbi:unnamed protein product [Lactuca virosa]|uniref:Uncharacterized protein n=1 Tax=Lactuca virosa TaxID=75947 RepID=A0AAU9N1Z9_9ASTR|nr:unnamed protein product [Lactuca virosa]